jgi:hypothetical protein
MRGEGRELAPYSPYGGTTRQIRPGGRQDCGSAARCRQLGSVAQRGPPSQRRSDSVAGWASAPATPRCVCGGEPAGQLRRPVCRRGPCGWRWGGREPSKCRRDLGPPSGSRRLHPRHCRRRCWPETAGRPPNPPLGHPHCRSNDPAQRHRGDPSGADTARFEALHSPAGVSFRSASRSRSAPDHFERPRAGSGPHPQRTRAHALEPLPPPPTSPARGEVRIGPHEVDFLWRDRRLIVETDGFRHHSHRDAFERDRARDARLQSLGFRVLRFTYRQVLDRTPVVAALRHLLGQSSLTPNL